MTPNEAWFVSLLGIVGSSLLTGFCIGLLIGQALGFRQGEAVTRHSKRRLDD